MTDKRDGNRDNTTRRDTNNERSRRPAEYGERTLTEEIVRGNVVRNTLPPPPPPKSK